MNHSPSPHNLASAADPQRIRVLQFIYIALGAGVVAMAIIFSMLGSGRQESASSSAALLSMVHGGMALGSFTAGILLFPVQLRNLGTATSADQGMSTIISAYVVRAALFEGPAVFGLIILFMLGGAQLAEHPAYWANLTSPILFLLMLAFTFPTTYRIQELLREYATPRATP